MQIIATYLHHAILGPKGDQPVRYEASLDESFVPRKGDDLAFMYRSGGTLTMAVKSVTIRYANAGQAVAALVDLGDGYKEAPPGFEPVT
jgi:hypothetical protein